MKTLLAVSLLALLAIPTHADSSDSTIYTYVGNTLNNSGRGSQLDPDAPTCQCNITGELTFAQPLNLPTDIQDTTGTPTSYSFSVDGYTLNQNNSAIKGFEIGDLTWDLTILGQNGLTIAVFCQDGCGDGGGATDWAGFGGIATIGVVVGQRGTWTSTVPEPASFELLAPGLLGLATLKLRKMSLSRFASVLGHGV
jgi:hypothetical protein